MKPLIGIPTRTIIQDNLTIHGLLSTYTHALDLAGAAPVLVPLRLGEDTLRAILDRLDGLLLAGGVDVHPKEFGETVEPFCQEIDVARDAAELALTRAALAGGKPILGICRGIQMLNIASGGSVYQDIPAQVPGAMNHSHPPGIPYTQRTHSIEIDGHSTLARALEATHAEVNSSHHQSLKQVAPGWNVVARAPDGIIEGIEPERGQFALGVQFHPEWLVDDPRMLRLFEMLVQEAEKQRLGNRD